MSIEQGNYDLTEGLGGHSKICLLFTSEGGDFGALTNLCKTHTHTKDSEA